MFGSYQLMLSHGLVYTDAVAGVLGVYVALVGSSQPVPLSGIECF